MKPKRLLRACNRLKSDNNNNNSDNNNNIYVASAEKTFGFIFMVNIAGTFPGCMFCCKCTIYAILTSLSAVEDNGDTKMQRLRTQISHDTNL